MTTSDDMLYCYLLDIVSHLQPLSHRCQLSFKEGSNGFVLNQYYQLNINESVYTVTILVLG